MVQRRLLQTITSVDVPESTNDAVHVADDSINDDDDDKDAFFSNAKRGMMRSMVQARNSTNGLLVGQQDRTVTANNVRDDDSQRQDDALLTACVSSSSSSSSNNNNNNNSSIPATLAVGQQRAAPMNSRQPMTENCLHTAADLAEITNDSSTTKRCEIVVPPNVEADRSISQSKPRASFERRAAQSNNTNEGPTPRLNPRIAGRGCGNCTECAKPCCEKCKNCKRRPRYNDAPDSACDHRLCPFLPAHIFAKRKERSGMGIADPDHDLCQNEYENKDDDDSDDDFHGRVLKKPNV